MGVSTDIMHDFVSQEIKHLYSSFDGWNETARIKKNNYDTIVVLERLMGGHKEIAKIGVTFNRELSPDLVKELTTRQSTSDGFPVRNDYTVIVPANTITSSLPANVRIHVMQSFAFDGENLVWVKKPVRKSNDQTSSTPVSQPA